MKKNIFLGLLLAWIICACGSEYQKRVEEELARGVRYDSLFFGMSLGMTSKEFYAQCWDLNKKHLLRQGPENTSVMYKLPFRKDTLTMLFYPKFNDDRIISMPVRFYYEAWAPWNRQYYSDTLQSKVKDLFEEWYGKGFIRMKDRKDDKGYLYVKVDGNRRIVIFKRDDREVEALFTDLLADQEEKPLTN